MKQKPVTPFEFDQCLEQHQKANDFSDCEKICGYSKCWHPCALCGKAVGTVDIACAMRCCLLCGCVADLVWKGSLQGRLITHFLYIGMYVVKW